MKSSNLIIVIITGVICSLLIAWALWGNGVSADTAGDNSPSASNMATDPTKNTESNTDSKVVSGQETSTGADTADATPAPSGNSQPQKSDPSPKDKPSSQAVPTDAPKSPENKNAKAKPQESTETAAVPQDEDDDPNNPYVSVNLKDVEMKTLISKVAEWTGKVIIPHQDVMGQKITIYAPHKLRQNEALALIYAALQTKGFIAEDTPQAVYLRPIKDVRLTRVPTITADEPLAQFEDKTQIVQKFFRLKNYSPTQLQQIILPLIPDYGYITADENTGMLVVIESVANLLRIEGIIRELDTPDAEQTVTRIFPLEHGEPAEIVQLVRLLIGGNTSGRRSPRSAPEPEMHPGGGGEGPPSSPAPSRSTVINLINSRVVLIPEPRRKWIIAQASAADMNRIAAWIEQLDLQEPEQADYEVVQLQYADVEDVARQLNNTLQNMPGAELRSSVMIQPLERVRQIMIFANPQKREMIKTLIAEIDIPSGQFITRHFKLTYADPEIVKENIESLFSDAGSSNYYYRYYSRSSRDSQDTVRVIAFTTLKQVTVIASAENMAKVEQQIAEWDVPIDVKEVKPMILELHNSDPVKMAELLSKLFTEKQESNRRPWWWDEYDRGGDKKKIVGALYGKLTFEAVPETRKIIVISQIPEAYEVVRELAEELDKQVPAELPMVITLKYADCEMLCEQLNAILNESGTVSPYRLSRRGLSDYSVDVTTGEKKTTQNNQEEQTPANQTT
ncbi:MAG: hypothetical protein JW709_01690, partial [Sedimentisphaerales bacterium]|nr:hypothetical protein [Sedimentisphaerales bacterium]